MTLDQFKTTVAAYLNRSVKDFLIDGVDLIVQSANNARRTAQRLLDFELLKCSVDIAVDTTNGGALASAVLHGTSTSVSVNRIERAFINYGGNNFRPAELELRAQQVRRLQAAWDRTIPWTPTAPPANNVIVTNDVPVVVRQGTNIYVWPSGASLFGGTSSITVGLDVVRWADDYSPTPVILAIENAGEADGLYTTLNARANSRDVYWMFNGLRTHAVWYNESEAVWALSAFPNVMDGAQTLAGDTPIGTYSNGAFVTFQTAAPTEPDFFLTDCSDWLVYQTVKNLTGFVLKEESAREVITQRQLDASWGAVKAWNESLSDFGAPTNLD